MTANEIGYTIAELCEKYNITNRTIYYYMQIGVLPPATRRGRNHRYSEEFAAKLEHALRHRGKVKLAHLVNMEQSNGGAMVVVIQLRSNDTSFMSYAVDATINLITKLGLNYASSFGDSLSEVFFVYPANRSQIAELRKSLESIQRYSQSYNGGVSMSFDMHEKPFDSEVV